MSYLLIDGKNLLIRAAMAMRSLSAHGVPTGGMHGFLTMLLRAHTELVPESSVIVCWDDWEHGASERKALYPDYKKRVRTEESKRVFEAINEQQVNMMNLLAALGIEQVRSRGWEADDVMATLATRYESKVYILTGDRDLLQCLESERVFVIRPENGGKFKVYDPHMFIDEFHIATKEYVDYKALTGDASDNIPGCAGVGPKGAESIIIAFGNIEKAIKGAKESIVHACFVKSEGDQAKAAALWPLSEKLRAKVAHDEAQILLSKKLAAINNHVSLVWQRRNQDPQVARKLLQSYRMTQLLMAFSKLIKLGKEVQHGKRG